LLDEPAPVERGEEREAVLERALALRGALLGEVDPRQRPRERREAVLRHAAPAPRDEDLLAALADPRERARRAQGEADARTLGREVEADLAHLLDPRDEGEGVRERRHELGARRAHALGERQRAQVVPRPLREERGERRGRELA